MAFHTRRTWPAVAHSVRYVIESRTVSGEPCTLIVERQADGPLIVSFHGAIRATAAPCPEETAELVEALLDARSADGTGKRPLADHR